MTHANVFQIKNDIENFFINTMEGYHNFFWILCDRPPELKDKFKVIVDVNDTLKESNLQRNWGECYPGRVLERMRKGRLVIQPWKWRETDPEYRGRRGPGYHPHNDVMPAYGRFLCNYVNSHVPV